MTQKQISEAFDADQASYIVALRDDIKALKDKEDGPDLSDVDENVREVIIKDRKVLKKTYDLWKNDGRIPGLKRGRVTYKDLCEIDAKHTKVMRDSFSNDHPLLIPRVVSEVVKEALEPNIVLTPLLQRIAYQHGTQLTFPAVGAITAADIPEGGEYPERSLDFAGQVVAQIGKSGVAVKFSEETIKHSLYDVMSMTLRAAGRALIRWKEQKVASMILTNAGGTNTLFDNTSASYPSTSGRGYGGTYNGGITMNDFFKAYAEMIERGFMPDTLLMNPFAWQMFADEGLQRIFGFWNGSAMWNMHQGSPGNASQWKNSGMQGLLQNSTVTSPQNLATTMTNMPTIFPYAFRIVVTPYMPYDAVQNVTDMVLCNTNELGVLVVEEEVMTETWDDPARDILKTKLRERYGLGTVNNGQGTGLIKGVFLGKTVDFTHNLQVSYTTGDFVPGLTGDDSVTSAFFNNNYS